MMTMNTKSVETRTILTLGQYEMMVLFFHFTPLLLSGHLILSLGNLVFMWVAICFPSLGSYIFRWATIL